MTHDPISRRDFVRAMGTSAIALGAGSLLTESAGAAPTPSSGAETAVKAFYDSLSPAQKKTICFPFEHNLRTRISANWQITKPTIGSDFYTKDQQKTLDEIVKRVTSEDGYKRFREQMDEDYGGFENYHVAVFGEPGAGKFEWELTGRHLTMRADGDSVDKMAFGGPIVYGHGRSDPKSNLFHYQTRKANEVFEALDGKQREQALLPNAPGEREVQLQGESGKFPGIGVDALSADQRELVEEVLKVLLAPYRKEDVDEAMAVLKAGGGLDKLHMAFYQTGDLNSDKIWDIWRVEGPTFVWHFRGAPHVHAYINIGIKDES